MGISSARVLTVSFGLGVALAVASGGLAATLFPFTVLSGGAYQLKSFVVTVLAGLGKPVGALAAGILLGLLEGAVTPFIAISWIPLIEFGLFVVALVLFPQRTLWKGQPGAETSFLLDDCERHPGLCGPAAGNR